VLFGMMIGVAVGGDKVAVGSEVEVASSVDVGEPGTAVPVDGVAVPTGVRVAPRVGNGCSVAVGVSRSPAPARVGVGVVLSVADGAGVAVTPTRTWAVAVAVASSGGPPATAPVVAVASTRLGVGVNTGGGLITEKGGGISTTGTWATAPGGNGGGPWSRRACSVASRSGARGFTAGTRKSSVQRA
jgi:hypothetical protein